MKPKTLPSALAENSFHFFPERCGLPILRSSKRRSFGHGKTSNMINLQDRELGGAKKEDKEADGTGHRAYRWSPSPGEKRTTARDE